MAYWTKLVSLITRPRGVDDAEVQARPTGPLSQLPNELLLDILDLLDASDRACLSLCDRSLGRTLEHTRRSPCLRHRDGLQRKTLLLRLAEDCPALFFCHDCRALHGCAGVPPPGLVGCRKIKKAWLRCVVDPDYQRQLQHPLEIHGAASCYQFSFQHLQLVMKRFKLGPPHGMGLGQLAITEVQRHRGSEAGEATKSTTTTLLSVEPQILCEELHLRVQQWIAFGSPDLSPAIGKFCIGVCAHINADYKTLGLMSALVRCKLEHGDSRPACGTCHPVLKCARCAIEFSIQARHLRNGRGRAVVITKWLNLGRGRDPEDECWKRHLHSFEIGRAKGSLIQSVAEDDSAGRKFEAGYCKPYAVLTDELAGVLEDDASLREFSRMAWVDGDDRTAYAGVWFRRGSFEAAP